jgi:hypothetical protein
MVLENIREIRLKNFNLLLKKFQQMRTGPERGLLRDFGDRVGISNRQLSHMKCENRAIGSNSARKIEKGLGLKANWMDSPHNEIKENSVNLKPANIAPPPIKNKDQRISQPKVQRIKTIPLNKQEQDFLNELLAVGLNLFRQDRLKAVEYLLKLKTSNEEISNAIINLSNKASLKF